MAEKNNRRPRNKRDLPRDFVGDCCDLAELEQPHAIARPCPFCGNDNQNEIQILTFDRADYMVHCVRCTAYGPAVPWADDLAEKYSPEAASVYVINHAIELWNCAGKKDWSEPAVDREPALERFPTNRDHVELEGVILSGGCFFCTACGELKPASEVGLRRMGNGEIRNQAQCHACRTIASKEGARHGRR